MLRVQDVVVDTICYSRRYYVLHSCGVSGGPGCPVCRRAPRDGRSEMLGAPGASESDLVCHYIFDKFRVRIESAIGVNAGTVKVDCVRRYHRG